MKKRPASEDQSWMWQPPLPNRFLPGGANQFAGGSLHPLKSSAFSRALFRQQPESLLDCVINASGGVVGKVTDWALSKAPDGVHQSDVAFLNQIQHGNARGGVFLCNAHDLGKVTLN